MVLVQPKHIYHLLLLFQQQQKQQPQSRLFNKFTNTNNRMVSTRSQTTVVSTTSTSTSRSTTGSTNDESGGSTSNNEEQRILPIATPLLYTTTTIDTYTNSDDVLYNVLTTSKSIAVIGASNKSNRDSYHVIKYLLDTKLFTNGIYPINPSLKSNELLHGIPTYTSIDDVFTKNPNLKGIDIFNLFRNSKDAGIVIENDIINNNNKYNIQCIWMQIGVFNIDTAIAVQTHYNNTINIIMNACPVHEIPRLHILEKIKLKSTEEETSTTTKTRMK